MAHNIQTRDVQVGVSQAWHGLTVIEPEIKKDNCRIVYLMEIYPLFYERGGVKIEGNGRQIVASDDGLPVGRPVGDDYKLISNGEIWDAAMSGISGTSHRVVSCGTVNDRSVGFISIKVADDFKVAGREHSPMINVLWGHGGNRAVVAKTGITTVVCQNTFNMAMRERGDFKLSIRHTQNAQIMDLSKAIDAHIGVVAEFNATMQAFDSQEVTKTEADMIYAGFLCDDEIPETKTGISRLRNTVNRLSELFASGKGNNGRTMADVFNGATDFFSHESSGGTDKWKQFVSSEFGAGANRKQEFFGLLNNKDALSVAIQRGNRVLQAIGA